VSVRISSVEEWLADKDDEDEDGNVKDDSRKTHGERGDSRIAALILSLMSLHDALQWCRSG
jgi:hypothetical protein